MSLQLSEPGARGSGRGRPIDETGNRYGRWLVLKRAASRTEGTSVAAMWKCRCDCGSTSEVRGWMLRNGKSTSCGCLRIELFKPITLPFGAAGENRALANIKSNAARRKYEWSLGDDEARTLLRMNCHYCGSPPSQVSKSRNGNFTYNGIDRSDNDLGYAPGNVVACCGTCNNAKSTMTAAEFKAWVSRVFNNLHERAA